MIVTGDDGSVEGLDCSWTHPLFAFGTNSGVMGIGDIHQLNLRQKWIYTNEHSEAVGITSLVWSSIRPIFFSATTIGSIISWPGLSNTNETNNLGVVKDPIPLQIWWGHQAMILDLIVPLFRNEQYQQQNNQITVKSSAISIEPFICTTSDDTTIRYFSIDK